MQKEALDKGRVLLGRQYLIKIRDNFALNPDLQIVFQPHEIDKFRYKWHSTLEMLDPKVLAVVSKEELRSIVYEHMKESKTPISFAK